MKIVGVKAIHSSLVTGEKLTLPHRAEVELEGDIVESFHVDWEPVDPSRYSKPGSYVLEGTIKLDDYPNPLVPNRADPHVYKHSDGFYYFTGSVPEYDRLVLRRSSTIAGLSVAEEKVIWTKHDTGEMGNHIWAPELHWIDGVWYVYFAAGTVEDKWAIRPYVLKCDDENPLTGEWLELGKIKLPVESFSLDATIFEHNGLRYLVWAQIIEESCLYIARMDNPWTISGQPVKISSPEYDWEIQLHRVNEGPAVLKRNGKLFIAYSASGTDHHYCMGLLTADETSDLLDPASWMKSKEPVFASNETASEYGPGHNSFTVSEDGTADILVYHARSYKEISGEPLYDPNRHARVQRLLWKRDGTPFFGMPGMKFDGEGITVKLHLTVE